MISKVTVTGADDKTDPKDLIELSKKYPFVEFGILVSRDQAGRARFPSNDWIIEFDRIKGTQPIQCSCHLCGKLVKELLLANMEYVGLIVDAFGLNISTNERLFNRWQINTHGYTHEYSRWFTGPILREFQRRGHKIIFQYDNKNNQMIDNAINNKLNFDILSVLFDLSHGAGVLPSEWPKPIEGLDIGYAGGLSPDNVVGQIEKILTIVGNRSFWIDAETWLRSDVDDTFDLNKVDKFLEKSKPYTIYK